MEIIRVPSQVFLQGTEALMGTSSIVARSRSFGHLRRVVRVHGVGSCTPVTRLSAAAQAIRRAVFLSVVFRTKNIMTICLFDYLNYSEMKKINVLNLTKGNTDLVLNNKNSLPKNDS